LESWIITPDQIQTLLEPWPKAVGVYNNVARFYGSNLLFFKQRPGLSFSSIRMPTKELLENEPLTVAATIAWDERAAPSLMHELLHLKLWSEGFPVIVPPLCDKDIEADRLELHALEDVNNTLQHANFFLDFVDADFPADHFYNQASEGFDPHAHREMFNGAFRENGIDRVRLTLWLAKYLAGEIEDVYQAGQRTSDIRSVGLEIFGESSSVNFEKISNWVKAGEYLNQATFASAVARIFDIIGLSLMTVFFRLTVDGSNIRGQRI
jgi:hypothetical protein